MVSLEEVGEATGACIWLGAVDGYQTGVNLGGVGGLHGC